MGQSRPFPQASRAKQSSRSVGNKRAVRCRRVGGLWSEPWRREECLLELRNRERAVRCAPRERLTRISHRVQVHRGSESAKVLLRQRLIAEQRSSPMPTECNAGLFDFAPVEGRQVIAAFDGGVITSDAGALLLGATDRAIRLTERFSACFADRRMPELVEHSVEAMVLRRVFGIALGYEDLTDHDELRHDPVLAVLAGKLAARRSDCAALAGKSTLNRLELSQAEPTRYHRIGHDGAAIEALFVDLLLDAHRRAPEQIILDLDATDDPLHGHQEG